MMYVITPNNKKITISRLRQPNRHTHTITTDDREWFGVLVAEMEVNRSGDRAALVQRLRRFAIAHELEIEGDEE